MGIFGQAKDLYKLQKQAKEIKKNLKTLHIEVEMKGIQVVVSAEQQVISVTLPEDKLSKENKASLEKDLVDVINKGMTKAQEVAAEKMRGLMGDMGMNLPGMGDDAQ